MELVECVTLDGGTRVVRKDSLILRPAVYGIVVHEGKVLLMRMRHTGKYHPPGGGVGVGEKLEGALKREFREETGIEVDVERFAHFEELFFYYDPSGRAYHGLHFYYVCRPKTLALLDDAEVDDDAAERPRWVSVEGLSEEDFLAHGDVILDVCRQVVASRC